MEDVVWSDLRKKYFNTISEVRYSSDGQVVVENKQYDFQINFKYRRTANSIVWTCTITDDSFFFHPRECNHWMKEVDYPNREIHK
jgi:hypothetical protein